MSIPTKISTPSISAALTQFENDVADYVTRHKCPVDLYDTETNQLSNEKIYIVSGNYEEFKAYVVKNGPIDDIITWDPRRYVYVANRNTIMGLSEIKGFYIGTWRKREDIDDIVQLIIHIKQRMKLLETS